MSLNTETGTGSATSESFISVADADTYHSNRGSTAWAALGTSAKEQALRKATDYMQQTYRMQWDGCRVSDTQALDWPRNYVRRRDSVASNMARGYISYYANDAIPAEVKTACAELALRSLTADLLADIDPPTTSESVAGISVSTAPGARRTMEYPAVDRLLAPLFKAAGTLSLVRA